MTRWLWQRLAVTLVLLAVAAPLPARAISVYSRKYGTSCVTCHTIYPRLTQFGEAFRRNGFRFPNIDSDYIKGEIIAVGQDTAKKEFPEAVWPSILPQIPGLGFAVNGRMVIHPDRKAAAAIPDNKTVLNMDRMGTSGSLYIANPIDDNLSFFGIASVSDTSTSFSETSLVWSDIVGPKHLASLTFSYGFPTLTPFGRSSAYVGGRQLFALALGQIYNGSSANFRVDQRYSLVELNGITAAGRLEYGVGAANGTRIDTPRPVGNFFGHLGYKIGGVRLDGENSAVSPDPTKPWADLSATVYGFAYRSNSRYGTKDAPKVTQGTSYGGGIRFQVISTELTLGGMWEKQDHVVAARPDAAGRPGAATQIAAFGELSYIVYPWLVPAIRVEHGIVKPTGGRSADDTRILPAIDMLLRANMKLAVSAIFERASGQVDGGGKWNNASGDGTFANPASTTTRQSYQCNSASVSASFAF